MVGKNIHNCLASTSSEQFQQFLSRRQHEKQPPVTLLPATILRPPAQPVQADLFIVDQPVRSHFDDAARSGIEFLVGVRLSEPQGTEPVQTTLAEVVPADPIHLGESAISPRETPSAAQGTESAAPTTLASIPMEPLKVRTCNISRDNSLCTCPLVRACPWWGLACYCTHMCIQGNFWQRH